MPYVWRGAHDLRRPDEHIEPGERFDPTDSELNAYDDLIEEIEVEPEPQADPEPEPETIDDAGAGSERDADGDDDGEDAGEFVCEVCGDDFDTPQGLSSHMRVHAED